MHDIIKMGPKCMGCEGVAWITLPQTGTIDTI